MTQERRSALRIKLTCSAFVSSGGKVFPFEVYTHNISGKGMMVALDEELAPGAVLDVSLFLTEGQEPLHCKGTVVWTSKRDGHRQALYETGIAFLGLDLAQAAQVQAVVDAYVAHQKRI